ncbi:ABC transporter substrate-binding protein [Sediminibacillus massiliensis]|uniref:ABC transporter substrate-binding protein n=1 Tax=Sediminibacillus massiliensis TaxID=1926277 RepID=UPI000988504B|nr:extracellular solute-binding protein [Sediminibacillus massiliensis]
MKRMLKTIGMLTGLSLFATGCLGGAGAGGEEASGNSNGEETGDQITLSYYSTATNESDVDTMKDVVAQFEEEYPEIDIDANYPAGEYESLLRVKMAANDMPDVFDTHGWAINRYGEYVEDLSEMDWTENLDPALEPILKDEEGKVYAYPLNQAKDGLTYNANVLEEYGVEPPETFDQFMDALRTIEEKSNGEVTPLWFHGSEKSALGQYFDQFATPLLTTHPDHNYEEELLNRTFDWSNYTFLPEKLLQMQDEGLLNEDVLTAQLQQRNELLVQGKIAFIVGGGVSGSQIEELNPDAKVGVMPMPAIHEGGVQSWIGGERHTVAIWKDTEHMDAAKKFVEFLAQPEVAKQVAEGTNLPAGLSNVNAENYYSDYYDQYSDVKVQPYFDRVYLPSGMWDVMGTTGQELLSGSLTPEQVSEQMAEEYNRLSDQAESE